MAVLWTSHFHGVGSQPWISASGLQDATLRMSTVAHNVANANTPDFVPDRVDSITLEAGGVRGLVVESNASMLGMADRTSQTELGGELVNLLLARHAFEANARTMQTQSESQRSIINAFG